MSSIEIGRLLRSTITGCVVGCRVSQIDAPAFGALVRIPLENGYQVYGLIHDMSIEDDGLVRQLVTSETVSEEVMQDNRVNRNVPVEIGVLFTGYEQNGQVHHQLPPRPPLTLDRIYPCDDADILRFIAGRRFGYFRHILRSPDLPIGELLAAHLQQTASAAAPTDPDWIQAATRELITLLRDDYPTLMAVLGAVGEI